MDEVNIKGLSLKSINKIFHPKGDIYHAIKKSDSDYHGFGEAYFSTINSRQIKGWNKHKKMTLNLFVSFGEVAFVIYDDRKDSNTKGKFFDVRLSPKNYRRLTVPPSLWVAFKGIGKDLNLILNIANLEHDPEEIEKLELDKIDYNWNSI